MAQTNLMRADEIVVGFNGATDRKYWRATIAGTRVNPEVHFNSRATMVQVAYRLAQDDFTVSFSKVSAAFGDYLGSAYRALEQVLASLKAAGLPFPAVVGEDPVLQIQYNPRSKGVFVKIGATGDGWLTAEPMSFKVPERDTREIFTPGVDDFPVL